jgi:Na+-driven multidrug efflux pump
VLVLALPASATFALMATEAALVNGLLARTPHAKEAIAAHSIYDRVLLFALQPVFALSVAMLPFAAHRIGVGDWEGVRRALRQVRLASAVYALGVVAPLVVVGAPWLAGSLAETELTERLTRLALAAVPLACLAGAPFLMARPVFEAMQRGRPGLLVAVLRYVVLAPALAWAGSRLAAVTGLPPLAGIIAGTLAAAAASSALFLLWVAAVLRASPEAAARSRTPVPPEPDAPSGSPADAGR